MGYFDAISHDASNPSVEGLQKALQAGYGANSAAYVNGRALIPENCESTMVNVVAALKEDCKLFNSMKTVPVSSTVHEENRRTSHGDYRFLSTQEGGGSRATDQAIERVIYEQKYLQTKREVTKQMEVVKTFEDAYTSEKIAGIEVICKAAEYNMFHGDAEVIPTDWSGFPAIIRKMSNPNIVDARGKTLGSKGEAIFDDVARMVWDRGGDVSKAFFPSVLAREVKDLFTDRIRLATGDKKATFDQLPDYPTAIGSSIRFAGEAAGANKFFHVKGAVVAAGDSAKRPVAPTSITAAAAGSTTDLKAGDYLYAVHAVNSYGISDGTPLSGAVTVTAGQKVTLTITPDKTRPVTGLIITRTAKGGSVLMEMVRIPCGAGATTEYVDMNTHLPGTASMLFLTEQRITPVYRFGQLLPVSTYPLYPVDSAVTPFLVIMFGALEVSAPEFCALVDNLAYPGGL